MNCQTTQHLIPSYLAANEPWLGPEDRADLEVHLAECDICWEEYDESYQAVEYFRRHWRISEDTQALLDSATVRELGKHARKAFWRSRIAKKVAAVAAAIVICLGAGIAWLSKQAPQKPEWVVQVNGQDQQEAIEIKVTENGLVVASDNPLATDGTEIREFMINDRHRLVLNRDTTVTIDHLIADGRLGCLVSLRAGQILAHVAHDGNPFEVHTLHGKAVITGTTFDVAVTGQGVTLVVSEGSVRFSSDSKTVQVTAGMQSVISDQGNPSAPVSCQANQLMAWALEFKPPSSERDLSPDFNPSVEELALPMPSLGPPIDLEPLDYEQWVEAERGWFKVQFPWIFVLQEAIRKNRENPRHDGSVPSYPELLLQTGDIWQAVYPERFYRIIPVANAKSLSKLATEYGLGDSWPTPDTGSVNGRHSRQDGMVFGLASLEKWLLDCRKIQSVCESGRELSTLFEHSQAMAEYLEHTRGLAWLCVQNGQLLVAPEHRERMLYLLRGQVAGAHAIRTILRRIENLGGGDSTLGTCQREIVKTIESIIECERGIGGKLGPRIIK